jgi:enoyl-CoA hydratase/carnithine racemase
MPLAEYTTDGPIAIITLSAGKANCYTYEMMRDLDDAILKARFDDEIHAIVIRGAGEKFFCAGADINVLNKVTPKYKYYMCLHGNETINRLEQTPKLVIAAINGHCMGGGLEVAMACDFRIALKGGLKIGLPEVNLGVLPGTGGTQRLVRLVGKSTAIEMMSTGRALGVDEAKSEGIVDQIFDAGSVDDFMKQVLDYAKQFCPPNKASKVVGQVKRACQSGAEVGFHEGLAIERELQQQLFESEDAAEGIAAYVEKRKPEFKGR